MSTDSDALLTQFFQSSLLKDYANPSTDPLEIISQDTERILENAHEQLGNYQKVISWLSETSMNIMSLSSHPRVMCRPKISKFVAVDALLNVSEYKLKYADYSVLSSIKQTTEYCQRSIGRLQGEVDMLNEHIARIKDQDMLQKGLTSGKPKEVLHADATSTVTLYDNGLVDIVEMDLEPITPTLRKAKFQTKAEQDEYIKNVCKK